MLAAPYRPSKPQVKPSENPSASAPCRKPASPGALHKAHAPAVHWHNTRAVESRSLAHSSCYRRIGGKAMKYIARKITARSSTRAALGFLLLSVLGVPAAAQKSKDKKKEPPKTEAPTDTQLPQSDSQQIDRAIGETLGYWQLGDTESLRKYYADDVLVVSGLWEPPVIGWENYARVFQAQRAGVTGVRMDRTNTYIKVNGNSAWATYQWNYTATMDGKFSGFRGHTTLVFSRQANRWLIVLDHSSVVPEVVPVAPAASAAAPAQP
jgi:ketosteroid isomerase-like protein